MLQSYAEGWSQGTWEEKVDARPCIDPPPYTQDKHEYYRCPRGPARVARQLPLAPAGGGLLPSPARPFPVQGRSKNTWPSHSHVFPLLVCLNEASGRAASSPLSCQQKPSLWRACA